EGAAVAPLQRVGRRARDGRRTDRKESPTDSRTGHSHRRGAVGDRGGTEGDGRRLSVRRCDADGGRTRDLRRVGHDWWLRRRLGLIAAARGDEDATCKVCQEAAKIARGTGQT